MRCAITVAILVAAVLCYGLGMNGLGGALVFAGTIFEAVFWVRVRRAFDQSRTFLHGSWIANERLNTDVCQARSRRTRLSSFSGPRRAA